MKIITNAILLTITLLAVPVLTYFFGVPLGPVEWKTIHTLLFIFAIVTAYCFIAGEITGNNSQVDKLWSLLPIAYIWVVASFGNFSTRLVLMAVLVSIWGVRLTINFAMKGGYRWPPWAGEEDYRWPVLRSKPEFQPGWKWTLFNLLFISSYQNALILLFTLPSIVALQNNQVPLGIFDWVAGTLMLFFIFFETIADIQQWNFQSRKRRMIRAGKERDSYLQKGFLDKGLWALSRHPNYFAEQAIWVCLYLFSVSAGNLWFNWSIAGCLLLIVLFRSSSAFSEEISSGKYPGYAGYQEKVPRFIPLGRLIKRSRNNEPIHDSENS